MRRFTLFSGVRAARRPCMLPIRLGLEILEDRLTPSGGYALPGAEVAVSGATPNGAAGQPAGFSPAQIGQAYGFNQIAFDNGAIKGDGSGQTIAIVDAYNDPTIASDLQAFDATYGLAPPPSFQVVNQNGGSSLPASDTGWDLEISLDVEWAHAMAPGANIVLVEANSNQYSDLMAAVNYARNQPAVSVVSMSWGGGEWSNETGYDSYFTTPAGHQGITFVASSGDGGSANAPEFPSVSPNVLAVGGTLLTTDVSGNYQGETAWSGSGGGISTVEAQPYYQQGVVTQSATMRTVPDVAYNSGNSTATSDYAVYDTSGYSGWIQVYGTSAGAPQWSALVAIADQGRALQGEGSLDGASQTLPMLYQLPQSDFHDITSGSNGGYSAGSGYDLVTGRGSPLANLVVAGLVGGATPDYTPPWIAATPSASPGVVAGTTTTLSVAGGDNYNTGALTYTWSVVGKPTGAANPTFSINGNDAAQNTTVTFHRAGDYTFQVMIANIYGMTVTSDVNVVVQQTASNLVLTPASGSLSNGGTLQFSAKVLDQFGHAMNPQPAFTWSLSGGGALSGDGLYTAPSFGIGSSTVYVSADGLTSAVSVSYTLPSSSPWYVWVQFLDGMMIEFPQYQSLWQYLLAALPSL
jgi:subtilase family serine protease